jgi:hypothetical protein
MSASDWGQRIWDNRRFYSERKGRDNIDMQVCRNEVAAAFAAALIQEGMKLPDVRGLRFDAPIPSFGSDQPLPWISDSTLVFKDGDGDTRYLGHLVQLEDVGEWSITKGKWNDIDWSGGLGVTFQLYIKPVERW